MMYSILGFSQEAVLQFKDEKQRIDTTDLLLLRWFMNFAVTGKMEKMESCGNTYYWLNYKYVLEELPILSISKQALYLRFQKLVKFEILTHLQKKSGGTYSFYGFGKNLDKLLFSKDGAQSNIYGVSNQLHTTVGNELHTKYSCTKYDSFSKNISPYNPPKGDEQKPKKKSQKDSTNYDEVLEKFKAICISLPKPLQLSDSRKRAIKKIEPLIAKFGGWEKFFEKIQSSSFLTGNKTQWKSEFDWVLKEKNAIKIIEGSYDDAKQVNNRQQETKPNLADSQQRDDTVATFLGLNSLDELEDYKQEE